MQKMQSNDLLKSNENNGDNAKVTAYMNATIIIPSNSGIDIAVSKLLLVENVMLKIENIVV
jgi:hypothetical protein